MAAGTAAIAHVEEGRLFYRGHAAVRLAAESSLEDFVSLLWTGSAGADIFDTQLHTVAGGVGSSGLPFIQRAQSMVPVVAARDFLGDDLQRDAAAATGWRLLNLLASIAADSPELEETIELTLARAWARKPEAAEPAIRAALILCAAASGTDHPAHAAASVAAAGAGPWAAASAALAAISSERYAGALARALTMFDALEEADDAGALVADFVRTGIFGESLPSDPADTAGALLELLPRSARRTFVLSLLAAAAEAGAKPQLPFALAALVRTLGLPDEAAVALFAMGRTIGSVAHAIEIYTERGA